MNSRFLPAGKRTDRPRNTLAQRGRKIHAGENDRGKEEKGNGHRVHSPASSLRPRGPEPSLLPQTQGSRPQPPPSDPGVQAPASSLRPRGPGPSLLPQTHGSRPQPPPQAQRSRPQPPPTDPEVQASASFLRPFSRVQAQDFCLLWTQKVRYLSGTAQPQKDRTGRPCGPPSLACRAVL
jgi:hypothetical protein